jgi:hypothetical protein
MVGAAMYWAAVRVYHATSSIWAALIFELSALPFMQTLIALTRVSPEPLLVATGLAMAAPLAPVLMGTSERETSRSAIVAGSIFGFGMVTKITFLPWLAVVFLYSKRRDKIRFALAGAASTALLLVPIYPRFPIMIQWFIALLLHTERYGKGAVGVPSTGTLLRNVAAQARDEPFLFFLLGIYGCLLFAALLRSDGLAPLRRVLWVACAAIGLEVFMVAKHPAPQYIVPVLVLPALVNSMLFAHSIRSIEQESVRRALAIGVTLVTAGGVFLAANQLRVWVAGSEAYVEQVGGLGEKGRALRGCQFIGMYRSSLPEYALAFGDDFAAGGQRQAVHELHPDLVAFNVFSGQFVSSKSEDRLAFVREKLRNGGCLILQGTRLDPSSRAAMSNITLAEVGSGAGEVLYRLRLDANAPEPLMASPAFPEGTIVHEAEDLFGGNVVVDRDHWGVGIGVITTPKSSGYAEYRIRVPIGASYDVYIRYASEVGRPLVLSVNGKTITDKACAEPTGGYEPKDQLWQKVGTVQFAAGENSVRLERTGPFPHVDKLAFAPVSP